MPRVVRMVALRVGELRDLAGVLGDGADAHPDALRYVRTVKQVVCEAAALLSSFHIADLLHSATKMAHTLIIESGAPLPADAATPAALLHAPTLLAELRCAALSLSSPPLGPRTELKAAALLLYDALYHEPQGAAAPPPLPLSPPAVTPGAATAAAAAIAAAT